MIITIIAAYAGDMNGIKPIMNRTKPAIKRISRRWNFNDSKNFRIS